MQHMYAKVCTSSVHCCHMQQTCHCSGSSCLAADPFSVPFVLPINISMYAIQYTCSKVVVNGGLTPIESLFLVAAVRATVSGCFWVQTFLS